MERANRITVQTVGNQYVGKFYRTHKEIVTIESASVAWQPDSKANSTANRESYRTYLIENAQVYGVMWNPDKAEQAWDRQHNAYYTNEEVQEDVIALAFPVFKRLADKGRYSIDAVAIGVDTVEGKASILSYVTDGKYNKNGAWCTADIHTTIYITIGEYSIGIPYTMEIKSGQICKPKMTIAQWNELVAKELELNDIVIEEPKTEDVKTA